MDNELIISLYDWLARKKPCSEKSEKLYNELYHKLPENDRKKLERLYGEYRTLNAENSVSSFVCGFRAGIRLAFEGLYSGASESDTR